MDLNSMAKKYFILLFLTSFVFLLAACPVVALAQNGDGEEPAPAEEPDPGGGLVPADDRAGIPNPFLDEGASVYTVVRASINAAYAVASIVALIYLILGGYQYITSQGNPDMAAQAKSTLVNSIVGLVIILCSYLIIHFVLVRIGAGGLLLAA